MIDWNSKIKEILERIGFRDFRIDIDTEHRHANIFVYDQPNLSKDQLPWVVESFNHILPLIAQRAGEDIFFCDINNYRKERENLLIELARAAARKVVATKQALSLPAMNSYERRIVHMELAAHPQIRTESEGAGKTRFVVIKPVE